MNAFFIGIGGMGMSGLAKILHSSGFKVSGSDRNLDGDYCQRLLKLGIKLYPQDGTGPKQFMKENSISASEFVVVKSTAIEDSVEDVITASRFGIEQIMRSDLLAEIFNKKVGIAIGGTAGKTTTTGIIAWILKYAGREPSCSVGGIVSGLETNAFRGEGPHFVIEADESDGSIVKYRPWLSLITNITRDHKTIPELHELFTSFLGNTTGHRLICGEDKEAMNLKSMCKQPVQTYGFGNDTDWQATDVVIDSETSKFKVRDTEFIIKMPGEHNVLNSLVSIAVASLCGIGLDEIAEALKAFPGMKRRFEKVGSITGVTVIDDFAHNPAEIAAAIATARKSSKRRFIVYQPHGFGPTSFTRDKLIEVFSNLSNDEYLFLDDIFYAGGTVDRDICSEDIINSVRQHFKNAWYLGSRKEIVKRISSEVRDGDLVLVMGARDINTICHQILEQLKN